MERMTCVSAWGSGDMLVKVSGSLGDRSTTKVRAATNGPRKFPCTAFPAISFASWMPWPTASSVPFAPASAITGCKAETPAHTCIVSRPPQASSMVCLTRTMSSTTLKSAATPMQVSPYSAASACIFSARLATMQTLAPRRTYCVAMA